MSVKYRYHEKLAVIITAPSFYCLHDPDANRLNITLFMYGYTILKVKQSNLDYSVFIPQDLTPSKPLKCTMATLHMLCMHVYMYNMHVCMQVCIVYTQQHTVIIIMD